MKRRALAWLGLVLVAAGFIVLLLALWLKINYLIPIGLILASFIVLTLVKKMPSDLPESTDAPEDDKEGGVSGNEE